METHDSNRESLLGGRDWDTAAAGTLGEALLAQGVPPEEVETLFQEGVDQLESGQNEQALAIFDRVLEFDPNHYKAWINRGNALANLKQLEAVIASYDKAM